VVALVAIGGHPETARLAAQLLRGVAEAGGPACAAVRSAAALSCTSTSLDRKLLQLCAGRRAPPPAHMHAEE